MGMAVADVLDAAAAAISPKCLVHHLPFPGLCSQLFQRLADAAAPPLHPV